MDFMFNLSKDNANCSVGILIMENLDNSSGDLLEQSKRELDELIQVRHGGRSRNQLKELHPIDVYTAYYKKFGYSYHVLAQIESSLKGKSSYLGLPLVDSMFMAELKNALLTAGHDLDKIKTPMSLKISTGVESYTTMNGKSVATVSGDYMLADTEDIISSILRGPDRRTAITQETTRVIYTVYAPAGVEQELVASHLRDIEVYIRTASEKAVTHLLRVF